MILSWRCVAYGRKGEMRWYSRCVNILCQDMRIAKKIRTFNLKGLLACGYCYCTRVIGVVCTRDSPLHRLCHILHTCLLIIMIMTWLFSGILFICALVVSFAARALRARAENDTTRAQINNIPSKSHVIPLVNSIGTSKRTINHN